MKPDCPRDARLYVFCSQGWFSRAALEVLRRKRLSIQGLVIAGAAPAGRGPGWLPVQQQGPASPLAQWLEQTQLNCVYVPSRAHLAHVSLPHCDCLLTACFPYRLPPAVLRQAKQLALNIHPALLPQYRGPDPVFWQMRHGAPSLGISLHAMTDELDAGPVLAQTSLTPACGATRASIDQALGRAGAELFLQAFATGEMDDAGMPQAQDEASYFSLPSAADYAVSTDWAARHAFNFMRATVSERQPHLIRTQTNKIRVRSVLRLHEDETLGVEFVRQAETIRVQFRSGVVEVMGEVISTPAASHETYTRVKSKQAFS